MKVKGHFAESSLEGRFLSFRKQLFSYFPVQDRQRDGHGHHAKHNGNDQVGEVEEVEHKMFFHKLKQAT